MRKQCVLFLLLAASLGLVACGESNAVVEDSHPLSNSWAAINLTVTGPEADHDKRKECIEEAHAAGVNISPTAPIAATVFLSDQGNKVVLPSGERPLGKWTSRAVCRVALAYALDLDRLVKVGKNDPVGCKELGGVQGDDQGFAFFVVNPGSYEGALAALQFNAHARGANYVVMDVARQVMVNFSINGRAYQCPTAPPGT